VTKNRGGRSRPDDDEHIAKVAGLGRIALVLISHRHGDHTDAIDKLVDLTGRTGALGGQRILAWPQRRAHRRRGHRRGGPADHVLATTGHTADSLSFVLDDAVLTADNGLGPRNYRHRHGDAAWPTNLESLHRLRSSASERCYPATGRSSPIWKRWRRATWRNREQRLEQVRSALRTLGDEATARQVVEHVYVDVDEELWGVAEWSVQAQLDYLRR